MLGGYADGSLRLITLAPEVSVAWALSRHGNAVVSVAAHPLKPLALTAARCGLLCAIACIACCQQQYLGGMHARAEQRERGQMPVHAARTPHVVGAGACLLQSRMCGQASMQVAARLCPRRPSDPTYTYPAAAPRAVRRMLRAVTAHCQ